MKLRSIIIRRTLLLVTATLLAALPACSVPTPSNPGPHQGAGVKDGKDDKANPAPHQGS